MDALLRFLNNIIPISLSLDADIRGRVVEERFKKGHTLSSPSIRSHAIWYISSGLAKEYYYDASGKMVITAFWQENELMVDTESFFGKKRSEKYIELIDDCVLLTLDSKQAHELQSQYPEVQRLGYSILSAAKRKDNERSQVIGLNAKEGNILFCKIFPSERISVSDAASFLGLIRTTLSTIRSKEAKSKLSSRK
jgi:CRP-like cAMP-binding protein